MKQSKILDNIQDQMKPGKITLSGFLGNDDRKLIDILIEDDAVVKRMDLTHEDIAQKMIYFKDKGLKGLGEFIKVPPHFEVRVDSVRGKIPCPFGDPGVFKKINTTVKNLDKNMEITYTDLNIHMIYAHGFYEGKGSDFRLEPKKIITTLEIKSSDFDYNLTNRKED